MTVFKSKKVKEVINNIKQNHEDNKLTWEQKADDWKERHILQGEELEVVKKELELKTTELKVLEESHKLAQEGFVDLLTKEQKKIRVLEESNKDTQISLLKEQHEKEIRELKRSKDIVEDNYYYSIKSKQKLHERVESLEKELEEKELLIEELESEMKIMEEGSLCHLDALEVAKDWRIRQLDEVNDNHDKETNVLLKQIEVLQNTLLTKDGEIEWLNYLATKELPALPKKENKFKRLTNKVKNKVNRAKEATKEKFQAFIVQKNK